MARHRVGKCLVHSTKFYFLNYLIAHSFSRKFTVQYVHVFAKSSLRVAFDPLYLFKKKKKGTTTCIEFHSKVIIHSLGLSLVGFSTYSLLLDWSQFWFVKILCKHLSPIVVSKRYLKNLWVIQTFNFLGNYATRRYVLFLKDALLLLLL